ncbi:adenylate/guanylate cyclase domain-containing protein [Flavobacteriaceae bacterium R38]|nr:adenylate/guanylate cyclase domain-containing protein [Flavobacteriaceae bacterium R38]
MKENLEKDLVEIFEENTKHGLTEKEHVMLFADFGGSTSLVEKYDIFFSSWLLQSYLNCASKIILASEGTICAFEGDGIMGKFEGKNKATNAVKCGFKIQWAVENLIQPKINELFPNHRYTIHQVVGIDCSQLTEIKTNIWEYYDILWVGRAANYSAILTCINNPQYSTYITNEVYCKLTPELKGFESNELWTEIHEQGINSRVFRSNQTLKI